MVNEEILYTNGLKSNNDGNKRGVLIIDPSKVVVDDQIKDRYVKQEDFIIYCSLIAYKNESTSVIVDTINNEKYPDIENSNLIYVNFLNPIKNIKNGEVEHKNKFTTDWADFLTSSVSNNEMIDPELFGISSVNVTMNASMIPTTTIEFIDIMGRTLFERGNDPNNPYNIFFTYPYPKYLLTIKGYYGTTIEIPLLLKTTNTVFDPSTGNYTTTAELVSDIFSLFNSLLLIYAYVAPYMFKSLNNDSYIGKKILELLYKEQNDNFIEKLGQESAADYIIENVPTMIDLANAIMEIKPLKTSNDGESLLDQQSIELIKIKQDLEQNLNLVLKYFDEYYTDENGVLIDKNSPIKRIDIQNIFKIINDNIDKIANYFDLQEFRDKIYTELSNSKTTNKIAINKYNIRLRKGEYINNDLFLLLNSNNNTLEYFELFKTIINTLIDNKKIEIEDTFIENQITEYGNALGWKPNLSNVIRIISNNIQTFLTLLEMTSVSAQSQILNDPNRINQRNNITEYETNVGNTTKNRYRPFPNYYHKILDNENEYKMDRQYPGVNQMNKKWSEIQFVEEIYTAVRRIKEELDLLPEEQTIDQNLTGLLTLFLLDQTDMSVYNNGNAKDILAEHITKFNLFTTHNGTLFRGISQTQLSLITESICEFEFDLVKTLVFEQLNVLNKYAIATDISNLLGNTDADNRLYSLAKSISTQTFIDNFDSEFLSLITKQIKLINNSNNLNEGEYENQFNLTIQQKQNNLNSGITSNLDFYNKIRLTSSPLNFSVNNNGFYRDFKMDLQFDLLDHNKYYCDNSSRLAPLSNVYKSGIETSNRNNNPLQGFMENLNEILTKSDVNTNFSYAYDTTDGYETIASSPALTFNNDVVSTLNLDDPKIYYASFFNQIAFK